MDAGKLTGPVVAADSDLERELDVGRRSRRRSSREDFEQQRRPEATALEERLDVPSWSPA